jgi:hypothetical protein
MSLHAEDAMPDGIDAAVDVVQAARAAHAIDLMGAEAALQQLAPRDDAVLAAGELRELVLATLR